MHAGRKRGICYNTARSGSFIASHITSILLEKGSGTFPFLKTLSFSLSLSQTPSDGLLKKSIFIDYVTQWNIQIFQSDFGNL